MKDLKCAAIPMGIMFLIQLSIIGCTGIGGFVPTPTHPCAALWCAEWNVAGLPVMICADTEAKLQSQFRSLRAADEKARQQ